MDALLEYYRRSVDELSSDEAVRIKDVEKMLRVKMRSGVMHSVGRLIFSYKLVKMLSVCASVCVSGC